jgi:manganese-dependent inorganic pyrophosphatase
MATKKISERARRVELGEIPPPPPAVQAAQEQRIIIIGHKNPDTDSVAAAAGYAELKQVLGENARAACAGLPSARTDYLFKKFNVPLPPVLTDAFPRVKDVLDPHPPKVFAGQTLVDAMTILRKRRLRRLPVVGAKHEYVGMVSLFDLADRMVLQAEEGGFDGEGDGFMGRQVNTSVAHIMEVLKAQALSLYREGVVDEMEVYVGAMSESSLSERMAKREAQRVALVVGNRHEIHRMAVRMKLRLMIVTGSFPVDEELVDEARSQGMCILQTPFDSATTVRRLKFSAPAELMLQEDVTVFGPDEKLSDVRDVIAAEREDVFPVVDEDNILLGILTREGLEADLPLKLILVDHNELSQAVDGADEVPIVEILDHHRLGAQSTEVPITFINEVVGSSCTLVTEQFRRFGKEPTKPMAGILMGGVITDTLMLRSPTSTPRDAAAIEYLAGICETDPKNLSVEILSVGSSIATQTMRYVLTADKKDYNTEKYKFAVAQVEEVGFENFFRKRGELLTEMKAIQKEGDYDLVALLVTNVVRETSMMLCVGEKRMLERINYTRLDDNTFDLPGVMSRKKQLLPTLLRVMS